MHTHKRSKLAGSVIAAAVIAGATSLAAAQPEKVVGRYEVKYEAVTSNCDNTGMAMSRGELTVEKRRSGIQVHIDRIPHMVGTASKAGRIKAVSTLGSTSIRGLDGKFSVAGTINADGVLQVVFVAEYYLKRRPYCTQSWNVSGVRMTEDADPPKGDKKSSYDPDVSWFVADGLADPARMRPML